MPTVVGVLRGGASREHEISLKSGAAILAALSPEKYRARDIYIDKLGQWHDQGRPVAPERILRQIDVALLGLHGEYGEDGEVQRFIERFGIPYTGADSFASRLAMHKVMAKAHAKDAGLATPDFRYASQVDAAEAVASDAIRSFNQPVVVKPVAWGSSVGVFIVGGYAPILSALRALFAQGAEGVLIEEFVRGREATVGVVEKMRDEALYVLPPVEILPASAKASAGKPPSNHTFFSYEAKYSGASQEICPGRFSRVETEELERAAKVAHRMLGLRHYSRSDFIVTPRGIYYLETNTLPGLTTESLLPKSLAAVGIAFPDFLEHLVNLALAR
ncbi:MAG: ATP-grasp domain-containing protein [bacterium]|nr:ATP-grasp domain-containing protein [bacterium]